MQIILVPDRDMPAFLETGRVDDAWEQVRDDTDVFLCAEDFEPYVRASLPRLEGRVGRVFVWWRDDYECGECDLEETLVPAGDWGQGARVSHVDALVVEVRF